MNPENLCGVNSHIILCLLSTIVIVVDNQKGARQTFCVAHNPINIAFGTVVAKRREGLGMTQAELASRAGMSRASIANIEKGRQNVLLHHVYLLAHALEFPRVGDLLPARPKAASPSPLLVKSNTDTLSAKDADEVTSFVESLVAAHESKARS